MRKLVLFALGAIVLTAGSALAQGECPEDVGAALGAACPCDADAGGKAWKNHGQYVSCVVRFRNDLRKDGCLDAQSQRTIARCAARSTCGKEGAVLCCVYDTSGTCDDAAPGDGTAAGVCSNNAETACDTDADCVTVSGPKLKRSEEVCTDHGGTAVGGGSVCAGCPALPPAP
jgi:hypothetical protein